MKRFDILTIFPEVIAPYAEASILGRAQKNKLIKITGHNLRDYSDDKHHKVDDTPYGGGAGMVMTIQPFDDALRRLKIKDKPGSGPGKKLKTRVVLTSASGKRFTQADAKRLAKYDQVIFLCGRYEGVDHRVEEVLADEALSIGDYVLTGGELPALVMVDSVARLVPGVLGNKETLVEESHGVEGLLEYPQYTKPEVYLFKPPTGAKSKKARKLAVELPVPGVLLSGNHAAIAEWRKGQQKQA